MGCDIHFYVERLENGKWVSADKWTPNEYAGGEGEPETEVKYEDCFCSERNYNLFAILADVRNGSGFAGCDTGDGFVPISKPRGLPDDVSEQVNADATRWDGDGHSHSWLTVEELLAYDWTQTTRRRGYLTADEYWRWNKWDRKEGESPQSYSGDVVGGSVRKVTEKQMQRLLQPFGQQWEAEEQIKQELDSVHCQCEWEQPYYKAVRHFLSDTMPRLWRLGKPEEVRCVFWFDN